MCLLVSISLSAELMHGLHQCMARPLSIFLVRQHNTQYHAEWDWVGRVPGAVEIEWMLYPGNEPNAHFLAQFKRQVDPEALVMFLCRSGARSNAAASLAAASGYTNAYNILEGFEGDKDASGHRNKVGGWRHAGLPWIQG